MKSQVSVLHFYDFVLVEFKSENRTRVVYIECKTVVTVIEICILFNNRVGHTNADANESSSWERGKENSSDDQASKNGE